MDAALEWQVAATSFQRQDLKLGLDSSYDHITFSPGGMSVRPSVSWLTSSALTLDCIPTPLLQHQSVSFSFSKSLRKFFTPLLKAMSANNLFPFLHRCSSTLSQTNKLIQELNPLRNPAAVQHHWKQTPQIKKTAGRDKNHRRVTQSLTWKKQSFRKRTLSLNEEEILLSFCS